MKVALVNPPWDFTGSIYFGCREPHLPLELGYARALLESHGHSVLMRDGHLFGDENEALADEVAAFAPDMTVVTTAPTYLFWRCAPPELRVPRTFLSALGARGGRTVVIGPHGSVTPGAALRKLGCDLVLRGEPEEAILALADGAVADTLPGTAFLNGDDVVVNGPPLATCFTDQPALHWPDTWIARHTHHHHRFDARPEAPGAEVEASRGCPYHCTFCAKLDYRDKYRRRDLTILLDEIDGLVAQGVRYLYFIDEIFLPWRALLEQLVARGIQFGVQTRIDLWSPEMLALLGLAGCVSIEAGVESLTEEGRAALDKNCRTDTETLTRLLITAREHVPFVQANLIATGADDPEMVRTFRETLRNAQVWANDPVPLYPYPSAPDYRRLWGEPDDRAWERAHDFYLSQYRRFSDIQDEKPLRLAELEAP